VGCNWTQLVDDGGGVGDGWLIYLRKQYIIATSKGVVLRSLFGFGIGLGFVPFAQRETDTFQIIGKVAFKNR
jgi:hypothetical protein